jgi:hypothetical protein
MKFSLLKRLVVVAAFGAFSSVASAAFIATIPGNDCAGVFGQPFDDCKVPAQYDPNETPIIIKFEFNDAGGITATTISSLFPTIDGSEFSFVFGNGTSTGTWTYNPGPGDPDINFFVAKGGDFFNLFSNLGDPLSDDWFTPLNPANQQLFNLSHLSFYDTNGRIPEPASLALLGLGLAGLAFVRRRKR